MIFGSVLAASVIAYATSSLRAGRAYRARTDASLAYGAAIDVAIFEARSQAGVGRFGTAAATFEHTEGDVAVTCEALGPEGDEPASGAELADGERADRRVRCVARSGPDGRIGLERVVAIRDGGGAEPGGGVEILVEIRPR